MFCTPTQTSQLLGFVATTMAELGMVCTPGTHNQAEHDRIVQAQRLTQNSNHYECHWDNIVEIEELHTADFDHEGCCKNPELPKDVMYRSNLDYLYTNNKDKYAPYEELNRARGYPRDRGQYDQMIQFWLAYFNDQEGLNTEGIDPLLIKAIIVKESSFDHQEVNINDPEPNAVGLMQVTQDTRSMLAGKDHKCREILTNDRLEIYSDLIDIDDSICNEEEECDAKSANANIAAGIRWLLRKMRFRRCDGSPEEYNDTQKALCIDESARDRQIRTGVAGYFGWGEGGVDYATNVYKIYNCIRNGDRVGNNYVCERDEVISNTVEE